ncbi:C-x8-C-x5-C-x3-H type zinc finger protein [Colletotrichum abscissum]|uniref:C-x8-C-x5-C-x3-H type zinc finger protein n=1 Tax=Colletotrichum abscissum TaxID=1671311 RepID=A0A9P9X2A7_9PEZI|nr:C-x8-C-x5-C-x3-H type zinc finger protein [Colletotrichum abscissum]
MDEMHDVSSISQQLAKYYCNNLARNQMIEVRFKLDAVLPSQCLVTFKISLDISQWIRKVEELIYAQGLIQRNVLLQEALRQSREDYDHELQSRRMWQTKANRLDEDLASLRKSNESKSFVFVIIDGDGAIFQEALLKKGTEGGAEASHLLRTEIRNYVTEAYPEVVSQDWNIFVQVFLNMDGLAKKLHASGIIPFNTSERTLIEFGRGFGRAQPLFSFIDVGTGKESADHKIREMLRIMVRVDQCKHVFFGPCHDNGYLPVLEPYKLDDKVAPKFTLIETTPAEKGFKQLNFHRIMFKSVFMSEKLLDRVQRRTRASTPLPLSTTTTTIPPAAIPSPDPSHIGSTSNSAPLQSATAVPTRNTSPPSSGSQTPMSTVPTLTRVSTAPKPIDVFSKKKTTLPKYYLMNANSQRIDEPLPKVDPTVEKGFNMRMAGLDKKFCNNYHLHGECKYPGCNYTHGDKLSASEMVLLKKKSRGIPCKAGSDCVDVKCIFGHHCRWLKGCTHGYCHFEGSHDVNPKPRTKCFEDGSTKIVNKALR